MLIQRNIVLSRWLKIRPSKSSEEGLTLLESLVAIVVIAAVSAAFTPAIFIAAATRAQNQRAEQAMHIAQGEIDRIRVIVETRELNQLPPVTNTEARSVAPPNSVNTAPGSSGPPNTPFPSSGQAYWIDIDKNNTFDPMKDMIVQSFRGRQTTEASTNEPINFQIGVRVYNGIVATNLGALENPPKRASFGFTTAQGSQAKRPLAIIYTVMSRNKTGVSMCKYHEFLGGTTNVCNP